LKPFPEYCECIDRTDIELIVRDSRFDIPYTMRYSEENDCTIRVVLFKELAHLRYVNIHNSSIFITLVRDIAIT